MRKRRDSIDAPFMLCEIDWGEGRSTTAINAASLHEVTRHLTERHNPMIEP
jgi:hypothetical protein